MRQSSGLLPGQQQQQQQRHPTPTAPPPLLLAGALQALDLEVEVPFWPYACALFAYCRFYCWPCFVQAEVCLRSCSYWSHVVAATCCALMMVAVETWIEHELLRWCGQGLPMVVEVDWSGHHLGGANCAKV
jgi:hypothetical protein